MQMSEFPHEGVTYQYQPPVEVGDHRIMNIHQLNAVAIMGAEQPELAIIMGSRMSETAFERTSDTAARLVLMNSMLAGHHTVTAR